MWPRRCPLGHGWMILRRRREEAGLRWKREGAGRWRRREWSSLDGEGRVALSSGWSGEGEDGCSGEGEGRDGWSVEGEDEEHGVEMGQSDGVVLPCIVCCLQQQGHGLGLSGDGVALQSHVMKAGCVSDCQPVGQYPWRWDEWRPCIGQGEGRRTWL